jgi:hypothetical protein
MHEVIERLKRDGTRIEDDWLEAAVEIERGLRSRAWPDGVASGSGLVSTAGGRP